MYFGVGVGLWIVTLFVINGLVKLYQKTKNKAIDKERSRKYNKKRVGASMHSIGSSPDDKSEFSSREFQTMKNV